MTTFNSSAISTLIQSNTVTPDVFEASIANDLAKRFNTLTTQSKAGWGKMNVGQMLKHVADNAEMEFGDKPLKRVFLGRIFGRMVLNKKIKDSSPNSKNDPTHPKLIIKNEVDFNFEKERVLKLVARFGTVDPVEFENRMHPFYGKMKSNEWSIWIYKHLDHHLRQFGA